MTLQDWRRAYPGVEAAIAAQGIDPARVWRITGEQGYRHAGRSLWQGDVEVFYAVLDVEHVTAERRLVCTRIPWPGVRAPQ